MDFRQPRKSMLGNYRSHYSNTTYNQAQLSQKKLDIIPKNLQIAELSRKNRNTTINVQNTFNRNLKNVNIRQPRKSMLGTHTTKRDSIIPPLSESLSLLSTHHDSSKFEINSTDGTVTNNEFPKKNRTILTTSIEDEFSRRDSVLRLLPEDIFFKPHQLTLSTENPPPSAELKSPIVKHHLPARNIENTFSPGSNDSSFIENETIAANEESVLAITITDTTTTNENSILASTLKDLSNISVDISNNEKTILKHTGSESNELQKDDDMLFKMLDLINTWLRRNTDSVEIYQKQIEELQLKVSQANEEIENMKQLKQTLIRKFSPNEIDKENVLENKIMATINEDEVFKSPPVLSPSKRVMQEMRSTIKFLKTPRMSRAPRSSVLLTPHSMSFCIKSQYEQLFE